MTADDFDAKTDEVGCQCRNVMPARIGAENLGSDGPAWALGGCGCRRPPRNAPHGVADIISDEQRPPFVENNPAGRPNALPSLSTKPVRTSIGCPDGRPSVNRTKITL